MIRRLLVLVAVALVLLSAPAAAQSVTTAPLPTFEGRPATECISALPRPDCERDDEFERSSSRHLILFAVLGVALTGIAVVVVRSTIRRDRGRARQPTN
jgi:hypothetical protein